MSKKTLLAIFVTGGMIASSASYADHNSIWGAGSANMPNDIHNTRIEDDNETFLELVQQGGGADSVNRYADDSVTTTTSMGSRSTTIARNMSTRTGSMSRGGRR